MDMTGIQISTRLEERYKKDETVEEYIDCVPIQKALSYFTHVNTI